MGLISTAPVAAESPYELDTGWKKSNHVGNTNTYHEQDLVLPKSDGLSYLLFDYMTSTTHPSNSAKISMTRPDGFADVNVDYWYRYFNISNSTSANMHPQQSGPVSGASGFTKDVINRAGDNSHTLENNEYPTFLIRPEYQPIFNFYTHSSILNTIAVYYRIRIITEDNARSFSL
jgi:hypothetical protein